MLFAGEFDEVSIHLFPRVTTVRVRAVDADPVIMREQDIECRPDKNAWIFCPANRRTEVESFRPTVFTFDTAGFIRVRRGEYVSWAPRQAIASETLAIAEAIERWNIQCLFVEDLALLIDRVRSAGIYFEEQT